MWLFCQVLNSRNSPPFSQFSFTLNTSRVDFVVKWSAFESEMGVQIMDQNRPINLPSVTVRLDSDLWLFNRCVLFAERGSSTPGLCFGMILILKCGYWPLIKQPEIFSKWYILRRLYCESGNNSHFSVVLCGLQSDGQCQFSISFGSFTAWWVSNLWLR